MDDTRLISRRDLLAGTGAIGAALVADSLLPGSALASRQSADQVTLNFWTNHDATDVPLFKRVIKNFEATHPNIKVNLTNYPAAGSNYDQTLIPTRAVSGSLGDVFYNRTFATADRASRGWLLDLTPFVKKEHFSLKDFWPAEVPQMMWKGKLYSLPYDFSDFGLFYNKTMFTKKGIKPPPVDGNWTWDQLFQLAKEFVSTSGSKQSTWGIDFVGTVAGGWPTPGFVMAWGGKWLSKDLHKFQVNSPQVAHMFQTFQDAVFKTKVAPRGATLPAGFDPWQSGKLAMAVNGSWATLQMRSYIGHRFDWDVVPLPKAPTGRRPISPAGGAWSIAANSKHPHEAWEFIKFLTSTRSAEILISEPIRSIPGRKSAVPKWVKTVKSAKLPPRHAGVFASQMSQAFKVPTVPYYNELTTITGNYVNAMLVTNKSVKDMLPRWEKDVNEAIKKYHF
jgi:multiple sugar transport system substrate-binding protein